MIPTIATERLTLRPHRLEDFEAFAAVLTGPRGQFIEPGMMRGRAWDYFAIGCANWHFHGYGYLIADVTETGETVGEFGPAWPAAFPEPEMGWTLFEGQEGKGYATEAAVAMRDHFYAVSGRETLVSYIDPGNAASIAVATRLGAVHDPDAPMPEGGTPENTHVYRHPGPEALA
ncbi:MAG: GNAT family N-acetyltransferase [Pseudomonadota bacterium]